METIKDVLCFVHEFDYVDKSEYFYPEHLDETRRIVVKMYVKYNLTEMIEALNIIDEIKLLNMDVDLEITGSLEIIFFCLESYKRLLDLVQKPRN